WREINIHHDVITVHLMYKREFATAYTLFELFRDDLHCSNITIDLLYQSIIDRKGGLDEQIYLSSVKIITNSDVVINSYKEFHTRLVSYIKKSSSHEKFVDSKLQTMKNWILGARRSIRLGEFISNPCWDNSLNLNCYHFDTLDRGLQKCIRILLSYDISEKRILDMLKTCAIHNIHES
ncbi:MAG: hypothetical protein KDH96_09255, partial [Candidatus Riesia sp.]|nr:hypothetical protein [Candidatus Riesia sp.]